MTRYRVVTHRRARRELESCPAWLHDRVEELVEALAYGPKPKGFEVIELQGDKGIFRTRFGDYRVVYIVESDTLIKIIRVSPRGDAYSD